MREPLDSGKVRFELHFKRTNERFDITEPIGFEDAEFSLVQNKDWHGRNLTINDLTLRFENRTFHQFKKILAEFKTFYHNTDIEFSIYNENYLFINGRLDFEDANTDMYSYIECNFIADNRLQKIEDNDDVEIDLFSTESIEGLPISEIEKLNVELKYKEIEEIIKRKSDNPTSYYDLEDGDWKYTNVFGNLEVDTTDNNLSGYQNGNSDQAVHTREPDIIITGETTIRYQISNLKVSWESWAQAQNYSRLNMIVREYSDDSFSSVVNSTQTTLVEQNSRVLDVPFYDSGNVTYSGFYKIYFVVQPHVNAVAQDNDRVEILSEALLKVSYLDIYESTYTYLCRVIDCGKQIVKSITNELMEINAPRFDTEFLNLMCGNGYMIRGFQEDDIERKFTMKWKTFLEYIREGLNCDYQLQNDGKIFIGKHEDFYKNYEVERLPYSIDKDSFSVEINEKVKYNKVEYEYSKFQDDKDNTIESLHQKGSWYIPLSKMKETLSFKNPFIADGYKIEYTRREGFETEATSGKENDTDVYLIDCVDYNGKVVNRTLENIDTALNIFSPETAYNLLFTVRKSLLNHYRYVFANLKKYANSLNFKSDFYERAYNAIIGVNFYDYPDDATQESADISESEALIKPLVYEFDLGERYKWGNWVNLVSSVRQHNGYVTIFSEEREIKLFPIELKWKWKDSKLTIKGELKND